MAGGFDRTGSSGEVVSEATLKELSASALFCLFANAGMCSSDFEDCVFRGGVALFPVVELLDGPRVWKECLCGEVTERRLIERRRLPKSIFVAECECR